MSFFLKSLAAGVFTIASFSVGATTAPVLDTTPQMAYEDISRSLTELQPITFQSGVEKYKILVFILSCKIRQMFSNNKFIYKPISIVFSTLLY